MERGCLHVCLEPIFLREQGVGDEELMLRRELQK